MSNVAECQYCGRAHFRSEWCECAEARRDMREFDAMIKARNTPAPATPEPPVWKGER